MPNTSNSSKKGESPSKKIPRSKLSQDRCQVYRISEKFTLKKI